MAEVVLWHTVPVAVHIDLETRQIERVVVIDDELSVAPLGEQWQFVEASPRTLPALEYECAIKMLEDPDIDWPAWNWGY